MISQNLTQKIIRQHLIKGSMIPFEDCELKVDFFDLQLKDLIKCRPAQLALSSDSSLGALGILILNAHRLDSPTESFTLKIPKIVGVRLNAPISCAFSAKAVIEELKRLKGDPYAEGKVLEYYGPGLKDLAVEERMNLAKEGNEIKALASIFPSDKQTKLFLKKNNALAAYAPLCADPMAKYDEHVEVDLVEIGV